MAITYATLNPSDKDAGTALSGGNLVATVSGAAWSSVRSTISVSSGKWYREVKITGAGGGNVLIGIGKSTAALNNYVGFDANGWGWYNSQTKFNNNTTAAYGTGSFATNDVIGIALDMDGGTVTLYKNNSSPGTMYTGLSGSIFAMISALSSNLTCNFGATAFAYTPPSGYNAGLYTGTANNGAGFLTMMI